MRGEKCDQCTAEFVNLSFNDSSGLGLLGFEDGETLCPYFLGNGFQVTFCRGFRTLGDREEVVHLLTSILVGLQLAGKFSHTFIDLSTH